MTDALIHGLGRLGLTANGSGGLTGGALVCTTLSVGGVPVGTEAAPALTTVGAGTVTAAMILARNVIRGGSQSGTAFIDTTHTASQINTALVAAVSPLGYKFTYVNNTNATCTLTGGTGVNSAGVIAVIPAFSQAQFFLTQSDSSTTTLTPLLEGSGIQLPPNVAGTLATNGAGTVTAALIAGQTLTRTTVAAAFIDTTATGTQLFAAIPNAVVGESFLFNYINSTSAACTLTGGTGVNSAGVIAVIPALSTAQFLVTLASSTTATFTMQHLTNNALALESSTTLATNGAGTVLGAAIAGRVVNRTTVAAAFVDTTDTASLIVAAIPNAAIGQSFEMTYKNGTTAVCTLTGGTGVNSAGVIALIPAQTAARFLVTLTSLTVVAFTLLGYDRLAAQPPKAVGSALTLTAAHSGQTILLDTAGGSVVTLPAATGTGNKFNCYVSVSATSNAHKILAVGSDYIIGIAMGFTGSTAKVFASPAATNQSIQMPFTGSQPSGGFLGDWFEFEDIGSALWSVKSMYQAGTTPTTPFSSSTS